jgi:hypothetical protein
MTGVMSLYRIELRATPTRWVVPWLVAGGLFVAWSTLYPGVSYWPNALAAAAGSVALTGPAAAAVMALVGRRDHHAGVVRRLSVRSAGPLAVAPIAAGATMVLAGHVVILTTVIVAVGRPGSWGPIDPWAVAAPFVALVVYAAVGYLAGRVAPFILTAPAAAITLYGVVTLATDRQAPWGFLAPYQLHIIDVWSAWRAGFFAELTVWLGLLALLLVGAAAVANDRRPALLAGTVVLAAGAGWAAATVVSRGEIFYQPGIPDFEYVCQGIGPEVCVHPAFAPGIDERMAATPGRLDRLEQRPRGVGQDAGIGSVAFHLDGLTDAELSGLVPELVLSRLDRGACDAALSTTPDSVAATDVVSSYLITGRAESWGGAERLGDALNRADPGTRSQWLSDHWDRYLTCSLDPDDTP